MVAPTGVETMIEKKIPSKAEKTDKIAEAMVTVRKF